MALTIIVGGADSDSYITLAEAEVLLKASYPEQYEDWTDLEDEMKEAYLRGACEVISYLPLRGKKVYCDQVLSFPRMLLRDADDAVYDSIPVGVKTAQAEIAFNVIYRADLSGSEIAEGEVAGSRVTQVSLGGGLLMVSFAGDNETSGTMLDRITRSINHKTYFALRRHLSQIRGGSVEDSASDLDYNRPCKDLVP